MEAAFAEKHTPHQIAGSFAIGVFVVTLPSLGLGLIFFLFLTRYSDQISPIAIFSSAIVINPLVKAPMYIAAFWLGARLVGPVNIPLSGSLGQSVDIGFRMIVGFVVLGLVIAVAGYVIMYVMVSQYRKRNLDIVETVIDDEFLAK